MFLLVFPFFLVYLLIVRESGNEGEKKGWETLIGCFLQAPSWGPGLQPRHVPCLGTEPATLRSVGRPIWCAGQCPICWAIPVRSGFSFVWNHKYVSWYTWWYFISFFWKNMKGILLILLPCMLFDVKTLDFRLTKFE